MSAVAVEISEIHQPITIALAGLPVAKQRARARFWRGKVSFHTPESSRVYEEAVRLTAWGAMRARGLKPFEGAVEVELHFEFAPPTSWPERKKAATIAGEIPHTVKPDADNLAKSWLDALNRVVIVDDARVTRVTVSKRYSNASLATCTVRAAP